MFVVSWLVTVCSWLFKLFFVFSMWCSTLPTPENCCVIVVCVCLGKNFILR